MGAPESATSQDAALSNLLSAAIGSPETSVLPSSTQPEQQAHDAPAAVAQRIEQYIGRYGRDNTATLLLYEAMKALRACPPAARDAQPSQAMPQEVRDALRDSAYLAGVTAGWNLGINEDNAGLERLEASYRGYLKPLRDWQKASRPDAAIAAQRGKGDN